MARALSHDVRLIVMDEPSAALDPDEVDNLFRIVGDLTAHGVAVVYISAPAGGDPPHRRPGQPDRRTAARWRVDCPRSPPRRARWWR